MSDEIRVRSVFFRQEVASSAGLTGGKTKPDDQTAERLLSSVARFWESNEHQLRFDI